MKVGDVPDLMKPIVLVIRVGPYVVGPDAVLMSLGDDFFYEAHSPCRRKEMLSTEAETAPLDQERTVKWVEMPRCLRCTGLSWLL